MNQYYKVLKFILTIAMLVVMVGLVYYMLFLLVKDIYLAFIILLMWLLAFFCDDWIPYVAFLIFVVLFIGEFVRLFTEIIEFLFKSF
ncbi:hypothetical protein VYH90_08030 [Streptococcus anginosus]|uniref:hypothetical protein n=1 Tax=Streptococcus anginosus TaxID=1328 RepID=UPI000FF1DBC9|nr:hypothetical protein [Streptococcus anginosus]MED5845483.1 hypothetical protein [Streptococcus anginosus]MED5903832.1 hypothetical protein [Streptococcus anginosus]MED5964341.1 hypothetical protein [Streptococcus anginosus]RGY84675.1 hypothetical protein DXA16_11455 [Streptococcus anginosus]WEB04752.1 hypothetical protein PUW62_01350 [Streptococcus anginosus]